MPRAAPRSGLGHWALATGTMLHDDHCRSWHPLCSTCPRATKMPSAVVSGFHASATREKIRGWCRAQRLNPPSPIHPSNASRCPCRRPWPFHYGKLPRLCALDPHGSLFSHNVWNSDPAPTQNVGFKIILHILIVSRSCVVALCRGSVWVDFDGETPCPIRIGFRVQVLRKPAICPAPSQEKMHQAVLAPKRSYHVGIVTASLPLVNLAGTQTPPLLILEPVLFLIHSIFEL